MTWPPRHGRRERDWVPDARDGLCRVERVILVHLAELERECGGSVPSALLYGRVCHLIDVTPEELQELLARLGARG